MLVGQLKSGPALTGHLKCIECTTELGHNHKKHEAKFALAVGKLWSDQSPTAETKAQRWSFSRT
jgi:hypothetical protein